MFGKKEEPVQSHRPTRETVRTDVHDILADYLHQINQFDLPAPFPSDKRHAVEWWLNTMQEPEKPYERPNKTSIQGSPEAVRWDYPYLVRVCDSLKKFIAMPKEDREAVVKAKEFGVYWRGDSIEFLRMVAKEKKRQREMGDEYRRQASALLRSMT